MDIPQNSIERNIAMELVRVTEAAAMSAMRHVLDYVNMDGIVVIGEGEKDNAPMLYIGEHIGNGSDLQVDIAVDQVDGTNLVAKGLPGAISVVALSARGTMHFPRQFVYMDGAPAKTTFQQIASWAIV